MDAVQATALPMLADNSLYYRAHCGSSKSGYSIYFSSLPTETVETYRPYSSMDPFGSFFDFWFSDPSSIVLSRERPPAPALDLSLTSLELCSPTSMWWAIKARGRPSK